MSKEIKHAQSVIASDAKKIAEELSADFQKLGHKLGGWNFDADTPHGQAEFLFELCQYEDVGTVFDERVSRLKGLLTAILAMQDLEKND